MPRSSSSHLNCQMPRRLASGAKISSVSWAMRWRLAAGRCASVRMLCRRSASLMSIMRTSSPIARNVLRMVSARCAVMVPGNAGAGSGAPALSTRATCCVSCVTPSTSRAISGLNSRCKSATVVLVSSTTSCSSAAAMAAAGRLRPARISATAMQCCRYGWPEARICPACWRAANSCARSTSSRSGSGVPVGRLSTSLASSMAIYVGARARHDTCSCILG